MRPSAIFILSLMLLALSGCAAAERGGSTGNANVAPATTSAAKTNAASVPQGGGGTAGQAVVQNVSLQQADASQSAPTTVERKIIRNAELSLETEEPQKAMQRVASVAEARGGFVVTSEARQEAGADGGKAYEVITVEARVPAAQFDAALADIRAVGSRVTAQKITGQDVTEEYIDLEARERTQKALEAQLLDIMKQAHQVSDAITVERELTNVRTEIERIEGRRRFLENQSSLSTVKVTLQPPSPLVSTAGFFRSVRSAFGDGIDIAAAITLVLIRVVLAMLPLAVFFGIPLYFLWRYLARRARRRAAFMRELHEQTPPAPPSAAPQAPPAPQT
jgi:HAMP domain-containing protein